MSPTCLGLLAFLAIATPFPKPPSTGPVDLKEESGDTDAPERTVVAVVTVTPPVAIQKALLKTFASYVGIHEEPMGSNNGEMVDKFNASCGLDPKEHAPWCASCAHYGYALNGVEAPGAYSPSWFIKARVVQRNQVAQADVGLVYFASKGRYAHTIAAIEKVVFSAGRVVQVQTLEGNTNAQGSREGDQFARRIRAADTLTFVRWWK